MRPRTDGSRPWPTSSRSARAPDRPGTNTFRLFWNASLNRLSDYLTIMQKETKMDDLKIDAPVGEPFMT